MTAVLAYRWSALRLMAAFASPLTAIGRADFFHKVFVAGLRLADSLWLLMEVLLEARSKLFGKLFRIVFGANQRRAPVPLPQGLIAYVDVPTDFLPRPARRFALSGFASLTFGLALLGYFAREVEGLAGLSTAPRVSLPSLKPRSCPRLFLFSAEP
jgi:hypothetical protein